MSATVDVDTSEDTRHRFGYDLAGVVAWTRSAAAHFRCECVLAAPSKLQRLIGERVKIDARAAFHLTRLLHLDEIFAVKVPTVAEEAERDLLSSRENTC